MTYASGATVLVDFPGHVWHGKTVTIIGDEHCDEIEGRVVWCAGPGAKLPIGLSPAHIAGSAEAQHRRRYDADEAADGRQGELGL